jgi:anti-sigma regulatory factor (Ser/Thr protein kinase)
MTPKAEPQEPRAAISFCLPGGIDAPRLARRSILSQLDKPGTRTRASDAALLVSELVTNSVLHADVGADRTLTIELETLDDRVRISVIDHGSELEPHMVPADSEAAGGFGLLLVNTLSAAWGVLHDAGGLTRVWFELLLDWERPPRPLSRLPAAASASSVSPAAPRPGAGVAG